MTPKIFLSPKSYNFIYSDSTGIIITEKMEIEPSERLKNENKKLREQNKKMRKKLEYLAKNHSDHVTGTLAQETLKNITDLK